MSEHMNGWCTSQGRIAGFHYHDKVRCKRSAPPAGTWRRYEGKVGTVARFNHHDGEIALVGPGFGTESDQKWTWFRPDELVSA